MGDRVGFNYGCYVNGFGGLVVGDRSIFGPYTMVHTANHKWTDPERPIPDQGWRDEPPGADRARLLDRDGRDASCRASRSARACVVGAGCVVVRDDLPDYAVAVGNPAQADPRPRKPA